MEYQRALFKKVLREAGIDYDTMDERQEGYIKKLEIGIYDAIVSGQDMIFLAEVKFQPEELMQIAYILPKFGLKFRRVGSASWIVH